MHNRSLTPALVSRITGDPVETITIEPVQEGFTSQTARVRFNERSIFIKQEATQGFRRDLSERFQAISKESRFYRELASHTRIPTPGCLYIQDEPWLLCLEDLGPAEPGLLRGLDATQAVQAVEVLARLHLDFAEPPARLTTFDESVSIAAQDMQTWVAACLRELPESGARDLLLHHATQSEQSLPLFMNLPQGFSHMDYRLENLHFSATGRLDAVLDWGEYGLAPLGFDLGYFLMTSLSREQRRQSEALLIDLYRQHFVSARPGAFSRQQLFDGYRLALLPSVYLPALLMTRGDDKQAGREIMDRCLAAVEDHLPWLTAAAG